jgi:RimJ/RimL family protein N-acetyltransferase
MTSARSTPIMPAVILETERLRLRSALESDIDDVYASCTDPGLQRWIPIPAPGEPYTRESAEHFCLTLAPSIRTSGDGQHWATVAVSRWALGQGFQRIEIKAATGNTASRRVAEAAGFVAEGVERNAMPLHEGRADLAVYSLVPSDVRPEAD